jgi:hypothetical protein
MLGMLLLIALIVALPLVLARIIYLAHQGRLLHGGDAGSALGYTGADGSDCAADGGDGGYREGGGE